MRKFLLLLIFIFIGNLSAIYAQSSFPYDEYKPRTLSEIINMDSNVKSADVVIEKKEAVQTVLHANLLHSQIRVKFMNKSRPFSADRKQTLDVWKKTFGTEDKVFDLYENEYLFKECEND